MDWSIQDIAKFAGTTSRTLRHYDDVGLLPPSRVGSNGYRYYDELALVRLQRILMLRDLGLGIPAIADVLAGERDDGHALRAHLAWLQQERQRIDRQISAVESTIDSIEGGEQLMAEKMFDGFDHTQYKEEVEARWGKKSYADSDAWWRAKSDAEKAEFRTFAAELGFDWMVAAGDGVAPDSETAQALAKRQADWLSTIPGAPGYGTGAPTKEYFTGLAEMYVADERFAANYGGIENARFVRDSMLEYAERQL
ncbi:MerR family transcriptional regulator [Salinibacterium soli]|uniref:MerR family transcriptional regulator n=1 Tax=Antiquaquibacter soli TaxID=3064523 RepID=A0ABT9BUF0_9MICO|nr:MerR family transcriptional regulator [Protaetiibacter sp. WY-16]MDO7882972.1 MerR family transcriptional regulator [Protaetiibacter sp. WY-16]